MNDYFIPELQSSFFFFLLERQITNTIAFLFKNQCSYSRLILIQTLGNVKTNSPNGHDTGIIYFFLSFYTYLYKGILKSFRIPELPEYQLLPFIKFQCVFCTGQIQRLMDTTLNTTMKMKLYGKVSPVSLTYYRDEQHFLATNFFLLYLKVIEGMAGDTRTL